MNEAAAPIAGENGASYTPEVSVNENGVTEITNKLNAGSMGFSVTKVWVDASNAEETRPTAEDFEGWLTLYRKSGEGDWAEVRDAQTRYLRVAGEGDSWTIVYAELEQYDESGKAYTYAVVETVAQETEYAATYSGTAEVDGEQAALNGETITNTLDAQTQVEFHKAWNGRARGELPELDAALPHQRRQDVGAGQRPDGSGDGAGNLHGDRRQVRRIRRALHLRDGRDDPGRSGVCGEHSGG